MEAYNAQGAQNNDKDPDELRFEDLDEGDVFKYAGRVFIKAPDFFTEVRVGATPHSGSVTNRHEWNAIRLTDRAGAHSLFGQGTVVKRHRNAAIYLKG